MRRTRTAAGRRVTSLLEAVLLGWLGAGAGLRGQVAGTAARAPVVREVAIEIQRYESVAEDVIRANLQTRAGLDYSERMVSEDVRNLQKLGYFRNVTVRVERLDDTAVRVIFVVEGNPMVRRVEFRGNKHYRSRKLLEEMLTAENKPLNEYALERDAKKIEELYRGQGYDQIDASYQVDVTPGTTDAAVVFEVAEGPRAFIKEVRFSGNSALPAGELRKVLLKTRVRRFWSWITKSGIYLPDEFQQDLDRLRDYYFNRGYVDMKVAGTELERLPRGLRVSIAIEEGRQYRLGAAEITGNVQFATDDLRRRLQMKQGDVFDLSKVRADGQAIEDYYGERGYADARARIEQIPDLGAGVIAVRYTLQEGQLQYIREIKVRGNERTKDKVVRREMLVHPGELLNSVKVRTSEQRLLNLGYFEKVDIIPQATEMDPYRDLVVDVEEGRTGQFMVGVGASSDEDIMGFVELAQSNFDISDPPTFLGAGQKMRVRAQAGTRRQDYRLSFTEPWFLDRKLSAGFDLYRQDFDYVDADYEEARTGGALRLGWPLARVDRFLRARTTYRLEEIDIHDVDEDASDIIKEEEGRRTASSVTLDIDRDTRDSLRRPTRGHHTILSNTLMGGPLGAETDLYRSEIRTGHFLPLPWQKHVLHLSGRIGGVEEFDDTDRVPIFERYFLGGSTTIRGFKYRHASPRDENDEPIGGRSMWLGSAEYLIPLIEQIWLAGFYDIGEVSLDSWSWETGEYNAGAGLGVRLYIRPLGTINLDYGWPVATDRYSEDMDNGRFHFNFGYIF